MPCFYWAHLKAEGSMEAYIEDRDIVVKVQVDPIRYDPPDEVLYLSHVNPVSALLGLAKQGQQHGY
jgi:hypothetical protein